MNSFEMATTIHKGTHRRT
ncbi:hypothetical protein Gohar_010116 [Gossypium harknessii]|uniref:Uncharacterized protein n=1 Tax=Gossypium harknessii TaxID=34285 RepID=A0A7J9GQ06_9ROSI|nr:hypothetical protein [Gossypium harknessii]